MAETSAYVSRVALTLLGATALYQGCWAQFAPRSFYDRFPAGLGWVGPTGPYAEHFVRDIGGLINGLGVLALAAAVVLTRSLLVTTAIAWLVYAVPHLIYHVVHPLPTMQAANVTFLTAQVVLPVIGLAGAMAPRSRPAKHGRDGSMRAGR